MSMSADAVAAFLDTEKRVTPGASMRWMRRNQHVYVARLTVESGGVRVGEVFLVSSVALDRWWSFKVLRRRAEILRWDFAVPPMRHRNGSGCGDGYPRIVRTLEHEHLWHPTEGMNCATPLSGLEHVDHRSAFDAFCRRAKIDTTSGPYASPPPTGEQLAF